MLQKTLLTVLLITLVTSKNQNFSFRKENKNGVLTYLKKNKSSNTFSETILKTKKILTDKFKGKYIIKYAEIDGLLKEKKKGDLKDENGNKASIDLDGGNDYYEVRDFEERDGVLTLIVKIVRGRIII